MRVTPGEHPRRRPSSLHRHGLAPRIVSVTAPSHRAPQVARPALFLPFGILACQEPDLAAS
jgi:hypothetical protein